jgi:hypothetical protein
MNVKELMSNLYYYLVDVPKSWYYGIKGSIRSLRRRFPYILKQRDWDYGYVLEAELKELEILRDGIAKYQNHVNWKRDVETLDTAIHLLKEIIGDDENFIFGLDDKRYVNDKNLRRFLNNDKQFDAWKDLLKSPGLYKASVREVKIWHLYHEYRKFYMQTWWD